MNFDIFYLTINFKNHLIKLSNFKKFSLLYLKYDDKIFLLNLKHLKV